MDSKMALIVFTGRERLKTQVESFINQYFPCSGIKIHCGLSSTRFIVGVPKDIVNNFCRAVSSNLSQVNLLERAFGEDILSICGPYAVEGTENECHNLQHIIPSDINLHFTWELIMNAWQSVGRPNPHTFVAILRYAFAQRVPPERLAVFASDHLTSSL